jgi:predicted nucleic acid-binding Zn ribbon protein
MPHSKGWRGRRDERTSHGASIGEVVDGLMRERVFARGAPIGRLAADWAAVVGPRLASESAPLTLERGVLVVAASDGPWGAQLRFLGSQIRTKANATLGAEDVKRVQVVVRPERAKTL